MTLPSTPRAVVTGAGGGLGRALCLELARRKARILVSDLDLGAAVDTARQVVALGAQAETERCDVTDAAQVEALAVRAEQAFGGVDLLVNNAGVAVSGDIGDIPLADWKWIFSINLWGVVHGCHAFVPRMKKQRSGHILNVASAAGLLSSANMGPYNVTKAGVIALSETLASELAPFGVGITALCPTFFQTNIVDAARSSGGPELEALAKKLMAKSKLQAPDVARVALGACDAGQLYCVPMADGQWAWRTKRLAPETFYKRILPGVLQRLRER
ncbi:MAG: SDR family NAD(P)-dependent oxidoreductase [Myxococcales bacterium]